MFGFFRAFFIENIHGKQLLNFVIVGQESLCPFGSFLQVLATYVVIEIKKNKEKSPMNEETKFYCSALA